MRTTFAAMAVALIGVAGCARDRCNCCSSSPCSPQAEVTFKPSPIRTAAAPAPTPASNERRSWYGTAGSAMPPTAAQVVPPAAPMTPSAPTTPAEHTPMPLPAVKTWWPAVLTPLPGATPAPASAAKPAGRDSEDRRPETPATAPAAKPAGRDSDDRRPETPATELPEPAKLADHPGDAAPQRPPHPETPADSAPEALNLGQTPEPEVAPIVQTGAIAEPALIGKTSILVPAEGAKVLTGVVESWRKTWRLRYGPIDVEDANGGRVTLIGPALDGLREGQRIRIRGILIPTDDRGSAPTFDVQAIEVLD